MIVATQLGVFEGCLATFPAAFVETKSGIIFIFRETSGHFLAGFRATKIVHFSRKVEPFSAVLVGTVF